MLLQILYYIPITVGLVIIAMFAFYRRNSNGAEEFGALSSTIACWLLAQFLTQIDLFGRSLFFAQLSGVLANFVAYFFLLFIVAFVRSQHGPPRRQSRRFYILTVIPIFVLSLIGFSPLLIQEIEVTTNGFAITQAGSLYLVQTAVLGAYMLVGFLVVIRDTIRQQSNRSRNYVLLAGLLQAAVVTIVVNTALKSIAASQALIPVSMFILVVSLSYVIFKHKLFDIQLIIARSIAYVLTVLTISSAYSVFVFVVLGRLFGSSVSQSTQNTANVLLAIAFGFSLPPLKRYFDRVTTNLFYRDAYDAQVFLDEFNKTLVSNIDFHPLLRQSASIIQETIKAEYCMFDIYPTAVSARRTVGTLNELPFDKDFTSGLVQASGTKKLLSTDSLNNTHLKTKLLKANVAIIGHLSSAANNLNQGVIFIGQKKSGNPYNKQDMQVLEIVINELVIAIQNATRLEEIQAFNATLQAKVNQATTELKKANEKLVTLNDTKDDFISMASHQLRTPLTAVKGNISMIMDEDYGKIPKVIREPLGQAFASSERMVGLIADLLNVSRLRTGKFAIQPVPSNLDTVVKSELRQLKESAASHDLTLTYDAPKDYPTLMLDEIKIRQVIMNFVDNAIYYTPSGGHIKVSLRHTAQQIEFTVVDDGIGVPRDLQRHLFTKFYRAANAQKMRPDGTGIGLFMAKKVIVASGGAVIFKSQEGKGSTFGFSIPLAKLPKPPKPLVTT